MGKGAKSTKSNEGALRRVTSRFGKARQSALPADLNPLSGDEANSVAMWSPPAGESLFAEADLWMPPQGPPLEWPPLEPGSVSTAVSEGSSAGSNFLDLADFPPPSEESRLQLEQHAVEGHLALAEASPETFAECADVPPQTHMDLNDGSGPNDVPDCFEDELESAVLESAVDQSPGASLNDDWTSEQETVPEYSAVREIDLPFESLEGLGSLDDVAWAPSDDAEDVSREVAESVDVELSQVPSSVDVELSQVPSSVDDAPMESEIASDELTETAVIEAALTIPVEAPVEGDVQVVVDLESPVSPEDLSNDGSALSSELASVVPRESTSAAVGDGSALSPLARSIIDQLFQLTGDGLALVTSDGIFEHVSPSFASLFSLMPVFLEGRPVSVVFQPIDLPGLLGAISTCTDPSARLRSGGVHAVKSNGEPVVLAVTIAGFDAGTKEPRVMLSAGNVRPGVPLPTKRPSISSAQSVDERALAERREADAANDALVRAFDDGEGQGTSQAQIATEATAEDANLPKRAGFRQSAESLLELTLRSNQLAHLIVIDVSDFNTVVARFGETAGDAMLRDASEAVMALIGPHDVAGRLSGSELGVLLTRGDPSGEQVRKFVERLRTRANALAGQRNREWDLNFTTGVAVAGPFNHKTVGQLLNEAEQARRHEAANGLVAAGLF